MAEAWNLWDRVWADDRVIFLPEPEEIEREFRARSRLSSRSPKVWADAYLLAFASVAGLKLITFDQALRSTGKNVLVTIKEISFAGCRRVNGRVVNRLPAGTR
jgi:predicted nucleic acid-binding protein